MSKDSTMKTTPEAPKHDWSRFDAMTEVERHAAALRDPDAQPLTPENMKHMKRTPQVRVIRRALELSQEECSARFQIPLGTLRDWERDQAATHRILGYRRLAGHSALCATV